MKKVGIGIAFLIALGAISVLVWFLQDKTVAVLQPRGFIAGHEGSLMIFAGLLAAVVVIPVFIFALFIAIRYREGGTADYKPDWNHNYKISALWGLILLTVISTLGVVSWKSTHELDPHKAITTAARPMTIQVVALQWKWLFIYPEQHIATINYVAFPELRPVTFALTSDAPMNSFWIPQLGGQMYAMQGMDTRLHLMADGPGEYAGSAAEISGAGFASMRFKVKSTTQQGFDNWVASVKASPDSLNFDNYKQLAKPSELTKPMYYASAQAGLYDMIMMQFMPRNNSSPSKNTNVNTDMSPSMSRM
jgi:cytochrome o ubiquinol oxidase subunit 2